MEVAEILSLKKSMRSAAIARRDGIAPDERRVRSASLCAEAFERVVTHSKMHKSDQAPFRVALFSSFGSEVSLVEFEKQALQSGLRLCYPAMVAVSAGARPVMEFFELPASLVEGKNAPFLAHPARTFTRDEIVEMGCVPVSAGQIDFVLVPLVAFDDQGGRLGYGGGNYDALLAAKRDDAPAFGVAFSEQRVNEVPRESHDLLVDGVIVA